jgi:hypothetical protein
LKQIKNIVIDEYIGRASLIPTIHYCHNFGKHLANITSITSFANITSIKSFANITSIKLFETVLSYEKSAKHHTPPTHTSTSNTISLKMEEQL